MKDVRIRVSFSDPQATAATAPDFPWVRYDSGRMSYNEALIEGRYIFAGSSPMGRPMTRTRVFAEAHPRNTGVLVPYPWHPRASWESAFRITVDGQLLSDRWEWVGEREVESRRQSCAEHEVRLRHTLRPMEATLCTRLDGTPFVMRWIDVKNTGTRPAAVSEAYTWSGRVWSMGSWPGKPVRTEPAISIGRFTSAAWGREGSFEWTGAPRGSLSISNASGTSGWSQPFAMLRNESTGEIIIADLAWSGNWAIDVLNDDDCHGSTRRLEAYLRAGVSGPAPLYVLAPGETVRLPEFHFGHLVGGLDEAVQALHDHLRRSTLAQLPAGATDYVAHNSYGYCEEQPVTDAYLVNELDVAEKTGAELFVIDSGWFGDGEHSWVQLVGDWEESPLLHGRLRWISDETHRRGMKFGLWVEMERMTRMSKTARAHPEWYMRRRGQEILQLDLAKPEVERHVFDTVARIIETYSLDCFRLDCNVLQVEGSERDVETPEGRLVENTQWRYYEALYRILAGLRERFPGMLIENCASGGGRNDLAMMALAHWTQESDNGDPQSLVKIHNGTTLALPPERAWPGFGAFAPGAADADFMLRIGLFGHFCSVGAFPSIEEIHEESLARWRHATHLYKRFVRPFLRESRMYHHTPAVRENEAGDWCVMEMAAPDGTCAMTGVWGLPEAREEGCVARPRGLDASRRYRVTLDNSGETFEMAGAELARDGVRVNIAAAGTSELLLFEALPE